MQPFLPTKAIRQLATTIFLLSFFFFPNAGQLHSQAEFGINPSVPRPGKLAEQFPFEPIAIKAKDGLLIAGNLYEIDPNRPVILLCHQANYNKYEYVDIAPRLNALGYNALAIDQRSGGDFADHSNVTLQRAVEMGHREIDFLDAEQDMIAAIEFLANRYKTTVILWGSSYSSSLAIHTGRDHPDVSAVLAFSPGNYFGGLKPDLKKVVKEFNKPLFITSSREEAELLEVTLGKFMHAHDRVQFIPEGSGFHGSKALWEGQEGAEEYWRAVTAFLQRIH